MVAEDDPPPSYESVMQQMGRALNESGGPVEFSQKVVVIIREESSSACGKFWIVFLTLAFVLSVTEIVFGSKYLKDCPVERMLPIYLIVNGVFGIYSVVFGGVISAKLNEKSENNDDGIGWGVGYYSLIITGVFQISWFISGSVWTFRMKECDSSVSLALNSTNIECFTKDAAFAGAEFYCDRLLYDYVYIESIAKWAVCGLLVLTIIFNMCIGCCSQNDSTVGEAPAGVENRQHASS